MTNTVFHVPVISADQYESFRREIGPDLADTYDAWFKLFAQQRDEMLRTGQTVVEVASEVVEVRT